MSAFGDNVVVEFATGALAAIIDCCLFHSIDTLKVRAQDSQSLLPWKQLRSASLTNRPLIGLRSLYQGFSTNLFLKVPYMACMFGFHSLNRWALNELFPPESSSSATSSATAREAASALFVGVEASLLLSPLELIRIQGQNKGKGGLVAASRFAVATIGLKGLLTTGMHACMQREAKYCLGQFAAIGAASQALSEWALRNSPHGLGDGGGGGGSVQVEAFDEAANGSWSCSALSSRLASTLHSNPDLRTACCSVAVGVLCTVVSHPDDVVKTRQQTRLASSSAARAVASLSKWGVANNPYQSYASALRHVVATEGSLALFKGATWRCCVRVPLGLTVINFVHPRIRPHVDAALRNLSS
mmetsp:Transcript_79697/g.155963  ORF Transcript_79697/g.155963 Transcript_79697/m.155963 type:complete len:358 (-) Transcript_79697:294-1367(-)